MTARVAAARSARALVALVSAATLFGCQSRVARDRSPTPGSWTAIDAGARDVPRAHDAGPRDAAPPGDAALPRDAALPGDAARPRDAAVSGDAALPRDATGTVRDGAAGDVRPRDASARDAGRETGPRDATPDWGPTSCGPRHLNCSPYACDVAAAQCKTFCTSDADCLNGKPCVNAACGLNTNDYCTLDDECFSGHCALVCCATACPGVCHSCALPGSIGVCSPVPAGMPDPQNRCPAGMVCGADAGCVPASDGSSN